MVTIMAAKKSMKSSLSAKTNSKRNTKAGRKKMPSSDFAIPSQRKYRIDDRAHARNALARVTQHGTPSQKATVRRAVKRKYPSISVSGTKSPAKKSTSHRGRR